MTALPTRHLFDSMDGLALLQRIDPASVPRSAMFYAGCAALFAFGGLSFDVSRRLGARAQALVRETDPDESLYEQAMRFLARVLEGDWADEHEIEPQRIDESLRRGQLWGPTTYLGLLGEKRIHRGRFDDARRCIEQIDEIRDLFRFDLAKTNYYYLSTLLPLEQGDLSARDRSRGRLLRPQPRRISSTSSRSARRRRRRPCSATSRRRSSTLGLAAELMASSAPVPPFHASAYHRSRLLLDVAGLERAATLGAPGSGGAGAPAPARARGRRCAAPAVWRGDARKCCASPGAIAG